MAPMGIFRHCLCFRPQEEDVHLLDYSHCCLDDVPASVFSHERTLEELYLDANQIRDLPRALFHCEGLRHLSLSDNELQSIPSAISSLSKLEELNISKNHILHIPETIKSCKCLTTVDSSINPLGPRLPDGYTQLINLTHLYLNDTFLEFLPANFGRLARLQVVELRENHLKVLPKSMSRLVELIRLDIGQNDLMEFPEVIGSLPKLVELWCDSNRIASIPHVIGNLKQLNFLDASYNKIEDVAPEIGDCESLMDLTLSLNNVTQLPETVGCLKKLTLLKLDDNQLQSLPASIGNLHSLCELVFNENEITSIPASIGFLRNLEILIGDSNQIRQLPDSIGSCTNIRILSLAKNKLTSLPNEIGRLSNLKVLNLNMNSIKHLPFSLTKLTQLQALWLSANQHKPLIPLQSDIDPLSGTKVLTCFLLPQIPLDENETSIDSHNHNSVAKATNIESEKDKDPSKSKMSKQSNTIAPALTSPVIKFSTDPSKDMLDDDEDDVAARLIRAPTPYPKELKAHARHARNLALKMKDSSAVNAQESSSQAIQENQSDIVSPNDDNNQTKSSSERTSLTSPLNDHENDNPMIKAATVVTKKELNASTSHFHQIKEAKLSTVKSDGTLERKKKDELTVSIPNQCIEPISLAGSQSPTTPRSPNRPTTLPVKCNFTRHGEEGKNKVEDKDPFHGSNMELVATKLSQLLTNEALNEHEDDISSMTSTKIPDSRKEVHEQKPATNSQYNSSHEREHLRKPSYKSAMSKTPINAMKGPVESKLLMKQQQQHPNMVHDESNDDIDRGYRSDHELYANEKAENCSTRVGKGKGGGYSSDWEINCSSTSALTSTSNTRTFAPTSGQQVQFNQRDLPEIKQALLLKSNNNNSEDYKNQNQRQKQEANGKQDNAQTRKESFDSNPLATPTTRQQSQLITSRLESILPIAQQQSINTIMSGNSNSGNNTTHSNIPLIGNKQSQPVKFALVSQPKSTNRSTPTESVAGNTIASTNAFTSSNKKSQTSHQQSTHTAVPASVVTNDGLSTSSLASLSLYPSSGSDRAHTPSGVSSRPSSYSSASQHSLSLSMSSRATPIPVNVNVNNDIPFAPPLPPKPLNYKPQDIEHHVVRQQLPLSSSSPQQPQPQPQIQFQSQSLNDHAYRFQRPSQSPIESHPSSQPKYIMTPNYCLMNSSGEIVTARPVVTGIENINNVKQQHEIEPNAWESNGSVNLNLISSNMMSSLHDDVASLSSSPHSNSSSQSTSASLLNSNNLAHVQSYNASNPSSHHHSNRWLLNNNANANAHVFPVIIVKNPGLGFTFDCFSPKPPNSYRGIYVTTVVEHGPASTALKVGDKVLQVDGIDLSHLTKDKADHVFQSTSSTVSLMVAREKHKLMAD